MKTLLISIAAAATLMTAAPAMAEFGFRAGDDGVSIGVGRDYDHDWGYRRHSWNRGDDCRDVVVQRRAPDGSLVTRHIRRCD
jgi:hypothetical protein